MPMGVQTPTKFQGSPEEARYQIKHLVERLYDRVKTGEKLLAKSKEVITQLREENRALQAEVRRLRTTWEPPEDDAL